MTKRLTVDFSVRLKPDAKFDIPPDQWITKHELEVAIKAIRKAHRALILEFRRRKIIEDYEAKKQKGTENATDRQSQSSSTAVSSAESTEQKPAEPDRQASAVDAFLAERAGRFESSAGNADTTASTASGDTAAAGDKAAE